MSSGRSEESPVDPIVKEENDKEEDDFAQELRCQAYRRKGCGTSHLRSKSYEPTYFGRFWVETSSKGDCQHFFLQPPSWMAMKVWEAELRTASSGWQKFAAVRSYNIRPSNSFVFQCVKSDKYDDLSHLFSSREASRFDRDQDGYSLIYARTRANRRPFSGA
jgi:hypothetical protein